MICPYCQKTNRTESKFCRFCGGNLNEQPSHPHKMQEDFHFQIRIPRNFFRKVSSKIRLVILLVAALTGTTVYAAPKINDFIKVRTAIQQAKEKQNLGEYQAAIDELNQVENRWSLKSQKRELSALKGTQGKFINYEQIIASSTEKESFGNLKEARELLQQVGADYPKYENNIQPKLSELQEKIENALEAKATAATAAKVEAEKRAQAEASAKARAQADAAVAAEAKARSDAAASAAASQARQAEYQRQQEEQQKLEERRVSFLNQLSSIYSAANKDGVTYYNNAMDYYNNGSELAALAGFGQAQAIFVNAYNNALDLKNSFSGGLPSTYLAAVNNMIYGTDYYDKAVDSITSHIASGAYGTSNAEYYTNNGYTYMSNVRSFLASQGY